MSRLDFISITTMVKLELESVRKEMEILVARLKELESK